MAVSKTARAGIREICDASEVPWTDKKIDERIRALRADARDAESNVSPEDLAEILTFSFGTVLASVYGQANVEAVARKVYEVGPRRICRAARMLTGAARQRRSCC